MTVEEVLKASGMTDEQIKALDAKVTGAFGTILTTAQQEKDKAELAKRAQSDQYDQQIAPALDAWANEKAQKDAEIAFYKTQLEGAKAGGFIPTPAPGTATTTTATTATTSATVGTRDASGRFVAGANPVPGSPDYVSKRDVYDMVTTSQWMFAEHMRLYGTPPPDDVEKIATEAVSQHMPVRDYVEKKYNFGAKREEIRAAEQKKHDDAIRAEVAAAKDKEWAEKVGNNPMIRVGEASKFSTLEKAVKTGERKDPLTMTPEQRHAATKAVIQKEIVENSTVQ